MKNILVGLMFIFTGNAMAFNYPGFDFPDFSDFERAQEIFDQTYQELTTSTEVMDLVEKVEYTNEAVCTPLKTKASQFIWMKLKYECTADQDFTLVIKAKLKNDKVKIKNYKIKF
ncbi:putative exported protein [Halobacteriovorax marinus SJ]|uniref:Exported protein n=1 Tax=Halobacteriovorax marinus (strain ATCC BAA-682 / DSM 15412 / SJ) TaxID=862908 RepID=E1X0U1_HALMS|nr:hypothetical protein [Halobacteriovorax marinus]CBW26429.1 putative exported protein [Halobacteriovorax marinus SJ]